ncbi:MAG: hypothetical protein ACJ72O_07840 [Marmoricola sp.]
MRKFGAVVALSVLLATTACGGGGSRPSQDDLAQALTKGGKGSFLGEDGSKVSTKAADCIAKLLEESNISDRALKAIIEANKTYIPSRRDEIAAVALRTKIVKCLPAGLGN